MLDISCGSQHCRYRVVPEGLLKSMGGYHCERACASRTTVARHGHRPVDAAQEGGDARAVAQLQQRGARHKVRRQRQQLRNRRRQDNEGDGACVNAPNPSTCIFGQVQMSEWCVCGGKARGAWESRHPQSPASWPRTGRQQAAGGKALLVLWAVSHLHVLRLCCQLPPLEHQLQARPLANPPQHELSWLCSGLATAA